MALVLLALAVIWGCQPKTESGPPGPPLKLSLGLAPFPYSGLAAIAAEKGFFKESGLDLTIKDYAFGFAALEALSRAEIQMAMGNEFSFAKMINDDPSLRLVASVASVNTNEIIARKDRNIHKPAGLKGKRIGFCPNTSSEYYLLAFLLVNRITSSEVTMVNLPAAGMVEAIVNGDVDAMSGWDTLVYDAKKRLPGNFVSWPAQNNRDWQWILVATFIAFLTGAIVGGILIILKKKHMKSPLPFGPFLLLGMLITKLWGDYLWSYYLPLKLHRDFYSLSV